MSLALTSVSDSVCCWLLNILCLTAADRVVKGLEDNILDGDALARFGARESEKFRFLGV